MKDIHLLSLVFFLSSLSCGLNGNTPTPTHSLDACYDYVDDRTPDKPKSDDLLVTGEIVRGEKDTSYNGPLFFTDESVGTISLECANWDKPSTLFSQQQLKGKFTFPLTFELRGSLPEFKSYSMCVVSLRFFRQSKKVCVGDLVSEYNYHINEPTKGMKLEVFGLESCASPDAGGFCLGSPRTFGHF